MGAPSQEERLAVKKLLSTPKESATPAKLLTVEVAVGSLFQASLKASESGSPDAV